jgi:hypothetical protein
MHTIGDQTRKVKLPWPKRRRRYGAAARFGCDFADRVVWRGELGFSEVGIADTDPVCRGGRSPRGLDAGCHGEMDYMARHGVSRRAPRRWCRNEFA